MIKAIFGVAIIGGGVGGLCLAQGLKQAGMNVAVYERDESPSARPQGFRIHIDPEGSKALHQCLPADLWNIFDLTGGDFAQGFTVLTEQLDELLSFRNEGGPPEPIARHRAISRIRLRQILLSGLGDSVKFGKRFVRYEETSHHRIVAHFEDGSTAEASILVGADGVNSPVRKQFLPHADPIHTTVAAIGGKIPLTDGVLALAPDRLLDGPVMVIPPDPCSLFMAFWKQPRESAEVLRRLQIEEELIDDPDYLTFGLGATADHLGLSGDLRATPGSELKKILRRSVAHWNPR
jgi:2-polyprenyl-6-methoxyphenol hydroxylase-like FAD-dependent oxidoreductase